MSTDPGRLVPHHGSGGSELPPQWVVLCKESGADVFLGAEIFGPFWTQADAQRFAGTRRDAFQSIQTLQAPGNVIQKDVSNG